MKHAAVRPQRGTDLGGTSELLPSSEPMPKSESLPKGVDHFFPPSQHQLSIN